MKILVAGATGATGRLLVERLLNTGHEVTAIVRSPEKLSSIIRAHPNLTVVCANILDFEESNLAELLAGSDAVASCLGHAMSFTGIYGQPRQLVSAAVSRLCKAITANHPDTAVRFVLMNTTGNPNGDVPENRPVAERVIFGLLRLLLPPHRDNELAADYLRLQIGQQHPAIEWVVVRPDTLIDTGEVSAYCEYSSPVRSALFDAGETSRVNVAHFMSELIVSEQKWCQWRGQMPVIYNEE